MIDTLNRLDTDLFLWLNSRYTPWLDPIMVGITERNTWIPFYALLVGWFIYTYRRQAAGFIVTIIAAVTLGDQLSSSVIKPLTHRLRPCHTVAIQNFIHPVMECGGQYGFVSSHAATTFGLAATLWLLLGKQHSWLKWGFLWAALVSYSRIYVAAHYPLDVLAGTGIGLLSATLCVGIYQKIKIHSPEPGNH